MTMAVSDIETQDLLKSIDAKLGFIVTIMAKNANVAENGESSKMEQDPFAEQRKWIGKLCWVWDDDGDERAFTKLNEIIEDDDDRPFRGFARWKHCEPVKPDDDIIYKGGNE